MILNTKSSAVPYTFTKDELEVIQQTFSNPLIVAFLQSTRANIMQERFDADLGGDEKEILKLEYLCRGQLYTIDSFTRIAKQAQPAKPAQSA